VNAANASGPAHGLKVIEAFVFGAEFLGYVYELHNVIIVSGKFVCVKYIIADKVLCFDALLQVFIVNRLAEGWFCHPK
jgi:hypothetical protein